MFSCPTEARGVLFRSELEALWALRWHAIGVEWVHEPCRVALGGRSSYTPDFALPTFKVLIQVKPSWPTADAVSRANAAAAIIGVPIYFLCGKPDRGPQFAVTTSGHSVEALGSVPFPT